MSPLGFLWVIIFHTFLIFPGVWQSHTLYLFIGMFRLNTLKTLWFLKGSSGHVKWLGHLIYASQLLSHLSSLTLALAFSQYTWHNSVEMCEAKPLYSPGQHRPLCLHFRDAFKTQGCNFEVCRNCRSSVNKPQFVVHFQKI